LCYVWPILFQHIPLDLAIQVGNHRANNEP
jgi:hypothetical protein